MLLRSTEVRPQKNIIRDEENLFFCPHVSEGSRLTRTKQTTLFACLFIQVKPADLCSFVLIRQISPRTLHRLISLLPLPSPFLSSSLSLGLPVSSLLVSFPFSVLSCLLPLSSSCHSFLSSPRFLSSATPTSLISLFLTHSLTKQTCLLY